MKNPPDAPTNGSGLVQLTRMEKSIRHKWVKSDTMEIDEHSIVVTRLRLFIYTMRHKFSNFHLIFKIQIGMKMK